jgi:hypothetical protein
LRAWHGLSMEMVSIMGTHKTISELRKIDLAQIGRWDRESKFALGYCPRNVVSGKAYQNGNRDILTARARAQGWQSSFWATWKQWTELGCRPMPGEKPARVYWRNCYHSVFNLEQVNVPDAIPEGLQEAFEEVMEINREVAREQGKLRPEDWRGYRWGEAQRHMAE